MPTEKLGPRGSIPATLSIGHRDSATGGNGRTLRRVLYIIDLDPSTKFGSLEEHIFVLARAFKERGGRFIPLFRYPLGPEAAAMYQAEHLQVEVLDLSRFRLSTLFRLVALVHRLEIQLVHWNMYGPLNAYLWALSLLTPRVDHWMTDHISRLSTRRLQNSAIKHLAKRLLFRRYGRVLGVSEFVLRCLRSRGVSGNLSCCYWAVNTERFSPDKVERSRVRADADGTPSFILLVVAYLMPEKGVDVAIRALKQLPQHVVLWIVGDGEDAGRLRDLGRSLSLDGRIRFLGRQRRVESYMRAADCLVCPSLWAEAAGLVILEALACGLPVVASALGGIPEFVQDGLNGFLFPAGDPEALAARVRRLLADTDALRAMKARARATALERFSIRERLDEYLALYHA